MRKIQPTSAGFEVEGGGSWAKEIKQSLEAENRKGTDSLEPSEVNATLPAPWF